MPIPVVPGVNDLQSQFPVVAKEWHPTKNDFLKPSDVARKSLRKVWWQCCNYPDHEWVATIADRTTGTGCPVCAGRKVLEGFNDLRFTEPKIAKEWHPTKNGDLKPTDVQRGTHKKVWWQCSKYPDHEWENLINSRVNNGSGCPFCAGNKVLRGFNDLQTTDPEIAKEWHPTKNGDLKPTDVQRGTDKKVWWQCSKYPDHEWITNIYNRSINHGCLFCSGQKVLKGFNDLGSQEPELAGEWHPTKNGEQKPSDFTRSSGAKVWWQCSKYPDHAWDARINSRIQGSDCPICRGLSVLENFNDLQSQFPEVAKEWHPTKNGDLKPNEVARFSDKKVWWQCSKTPEHEWSAKITNLTVLSQGCPFCAEYGFNPEKDAWFYLMERPGEQQFGISNFITDRLKTHESNGWVLLEHTKPASGQKVLDAEKVFKKWLKKEIGLMEGTTENWSTTKMEVQSLAELKARSGIETDLF